MQESIRRLGLAFGGVSLGWDRAADRTALPGRALDGTSRSVVVGETASDKIKSRGAR